MKATARTLARYVNQRLDKHDIDNVSINLPRLNKHTLNSLRSNYNFSSVTLEPFGYIRFERCGQ